MKQWSEVVAEDWFEFYVATNELPENSQMGDSIPVPGHNFEGVWYGTSNGMAFINVLMDVAMTHTKYGQLVKYPNGEGYIVGVDMAQQKLAIGKLPLPENEDDWSYDKFLKNIKANVHFTQVTAR